MKYIDILCTGITMPAEIPFSLKKLFINTMRFLSLIIFVIGISSIMLSAKMVKGQEADKVFIRFSVKAASLESVIKQIEKQTPFHFIIDEKLARSIKNITLPEQRYSIKEILVTILNPQYLTFEQDGKKIIITKKEPASFLNEQENNEQKFPAVSELVQTLIKGRVVDEKNEPLPGVTIQEKNTLISTVSQTDGGFSINVSNTKAVLLFTYVGMVPQEVQLSGNEFLTIQLKPTQSSLSEIVVVGYGTQKKTDLTGAVSSLKGATLTKAAMPNLANALVGKMTGVISTQQSGKPGFDDPQFFIRGKSTFGDNGALILVDGIERPAGRVDPNEIESVTILKDAASTAVYGARAANGVILITTKRGVEGKAKVSFTSTFGVQQPARVPQLMNAYEYASNLNIGLKNMGAQPRFTDDEIAKYKSGALPSTNWWGASVKKSTPVYQNDLTVSGGNNAVKYFVSLGYLDQHGLYDLSFFKRYNVRSNLDIKITNDLKLSVDLAGRLEKTNQSSLGDAVFNFAINSKPTERAYTPDNVAVGGLGSNGFAASPIGQALYSGYNKTNSNITQTMVTAVYNVSFIKGLNAKVNYAYDPTNSRNKVFSTPYNFYEYNKLSDTYTEKPSSAKITLTQTDAESWLQTLQTSVNYNRDFGLHNISGLVLFEQSSTNSSMLQAYREGFLSPCY